MKLVIYPFLLIVLLSTTYQPLITSNNYAAFLYCFLRNHACKFVLDLLGKHKLDLVPSVIEEETTSYAGMVKEGEEACPPQRKKIKVRFCLHPTIDDLSCQASPAKVCSNSMYAVHSHFCPLYATIFHADV